VSSCGLTVKLKGRTTTPDGRRGPTISPGSRGARQTTPHGPLQRLLGAIAVIRAPEMGWQMRRYKANHRVGVRIKDQVHGKAGGTTYKRDNPRPECDLPDIAPGKV
jgi:hypothetical protein